MANRGIDEILLDLLGEEAAAPASRALSPVRGRQELNAESMPNIVHMVYLSARCDSVASAARGRCQYTCS